MAQKNINIGTPNGQDGDFVRDAFSKSEDNFTELYGRVEDIGGLLDGGGYLNNDGTFTWVRYAEDIEGLNMSPIKLATSNFIGYSFNNPVKEPSTNGEDYIWLPLTAVKGRDGIDGANGIEGLDGSTGLQGPNGLNGLPTYFHIAYADDKDGGGFSQHPFEKKFIGTYSDYTIEDSTTVTDYTWIEVKGIDGTKGTAGVNAIDGLTYYLHIAYANSADGITDFDIVESEDKKYIGTLVDLIEEDSTTPGEYDWSRILNSEDGIFDGEYWTWIKFTYNPDGTEPLLDTEEGMRYQGFAFNKITPVESDIFSDYQWHLIYEDNDVISKTSQLFNDGETGEGKYIELKDVPGFENLDETFTHVMYSVDIDGTNMSPQRLSTSNFIGHSFNQPLAKLSENPNDYIWTPLVILKGRDGIDGANGIDALDGRQGIQGPAGLDGKPTYFHIAYANDNAGKDFNQHPFNRKWIGTYSDYISVDSDKWEDYTWVEVAGIDGTIGMPGINAVDGLTYYLHIAYANSIDGLTGFDIVESENKLFIGTLVDLVEADSLTPGDYNWARILNPNTIENEDGTFTWVKYTVTPDGNSPLEDSEIGMRYKGMSFNNISAIPSLDYTEYEWHLIYKDVEIISTTSQLFNDGATGESKYVEFKDLIAPGINPAIENNYTDIAEMLADQASQTLNFIQYVDDATLDPTVNPEGVTYAYYEYLGTTVGDLTDYRRLSEQEIIDLLTITRTSQLINDGENGVDKFITANDANLIGVDRIISGSVLWTGTGYIFKSVNLVYELNGAIYESNGDEVTLTAPDVSNPRLDVIYVDISGLGFKTGVAGVTPSEPVLDIPAEQLKASLVLVQNGTTTPTEYTNTTVYAENAQIVGGEWNTSENTSGVRINLANTVAPLFDTYDIKTNTRLEDGDSITFDYDSSYIDTATFNSMLLHFKSSKAWRGDSLVVRFTKDNAFAGSYFINAGDFETQGDLTSEVYIFGNKITWDEASFNEITIQVVKGTTGIQPTFINFQLDNIIIQNSGTVNPIKKIVTGGLQEVTVAGNHTLLGIETEGYKFNNLRNTVSYINSTIPTITGAAHMLTLGRDGYLYQASYTAIHRINIETGITEYYGDPDAGASDYIQADSNGSVYASGSATGSFYKITKIDSIGNLAVAIESFTGDGSRPIVLDDNDNLYYKTPNVNSITRLTASGTKSVLTTISDKLSAITFKDGYLYCALDNLELVKIDVLTGTSTLIGSLETIAEHIKVASNGDIFTASTVYSPKAINKLTPEGVSSQVTLITVFSGIFGIDIDRYDNLYYIEEAEKLIKINPYSLDTEIIYTDTSGDTFPLGQMVINGNIAYTSVRAGDVVVSTPSSTQLLTLDNWGNIVKEGNIEVSSKGVISVPNIYINDIVNPKDLVTKEWITAQDFVNAIGNGIFLFLSDITTAPTSNTDTGSKGEVRVVGAFRYECIATNTWVRSAVTTTF